MSAARVLIADPNALVRSLLRTALLQGGVTVVAETGTVDDAVRAVARGDIALHPVAAATVVDQWRRLRVGAGGSTVGNQRLALTPREVDVLAAMADGLSTKGIARRLGVAVKTVENHKT